MRKSGPRPGPVGPARLQQEWLAAYTAAFVEIAVSRGWRRENAETWPVGIGDEAFFEAYRFNWDPRRAAAEDVVVCEEPPSLSH